LTETRLPRSVPNLTGSFGTVKTDKNGNYYTNTIGTKNYVMQEMLQLTSKSRTGNVPGACKNVY